MSRTIPATLAVLIGVLSSPPLFAMPGAAAEESGTAVLTPDVNPDFEALAAGHLTRALDLKSVTTLDGIIWPLSKVRVVFVGEGHDRYEHHLNQLDIIRSLHEGKPDLAIGMEFFQWPFQSVLDRYIAGEIDERTFLRETEYYKRWRYDYRLYRPILQYARENRIPYLGICLGMQVAVIEFARNVAKLADAHSTEFNRGTPNPVIGLITEWLNADGKVEKRSENSDLGGTMRLGGQECQLQPNSLTSQLYGKEVIVERHRHRYEFNNSYLDDIVTAGMKVAGRSVDGRLVEIVEVPDHPWFVACQFHPEFTSTPRYGHPLFSGFIEAAKKHRDGQS